MLKFLRNKIISVDRPKANELTVQAILDDDLYGLTMEATFTEDELKIIKIDGKWHRWTTPECPRALDQLQPALGLKVGSGFRGSVSKIIGRGACRHFGNLLNEMGHAAKNAKLFIEWQESKEKNPELDINDFVSSWAFENKSSTQESSKPDDNKKAIPTTGKVPLADVQRPEGGFLIDMHIHTSQASPCSSISVEKIIEEAKEIGLNGIVLTDHNYLWNSDDIKSLQQKHDILILSGNEIITEHGDVLVYGFNKAVDGIIKLADLRREVQAEGGFMSMAHPFRGFLITGADQMGLSVDKAASREMFKYVDAVEVLNGKVTPDENNFSANVCEKTGLSGTGGSDTHETGTVGCYATEFNVKINNEKEFLEALHFGNYRAVRVR